MKVLIIILLLSSAAFGQENPWENKNKENPWGNRSKKVEKKDTIQISETQPKKDTNAIKLVENRAIETPANEYMLIESAKNKVAREYKSGNDFAVGFTTGLFLNFFGVVPDIPYILIDSKQEKRIEKNINSDSTYVSVDDKELRNKTNNTVKSKKFFATIGGTAVGSLTQIFAFILLIAAF